jgi:hypothetical protein
MISIVATAALALGAMMAAPQPLHWEADYGKALKATRSSDAPLLVVLDKPNSRDARFKPALLSSSGDQKEAKLLKPYRLCHIDVTTKYGRKVAKAFQATSFPHVAIIDKSGSSVIFRKSGQIDNAEWQRILTRYESGEQSLAKNVSRTTYKPSVDIGTEVLRPSCPNCQRNSF